MPDLSPRERRRLLKTLNALPSSIFGEVLFSLDVPAGLVPNSTASQGERTLKLMEWVEMPDMGCGLPTLKEMVEEVVAEYNYKLPPDDEDDEEPQATEAGASSTQASPSPSSSNGSSGVRDQVFVSYSHKDSEWLEKLQVNLKPLIRKGAINLWDDTQILPGAKWRDEINNALARAKVAVLLVSSDFLNSDFIEEKELPQLLSAAENEGLTVIWVPVRPSLYEETEIAEYQAAHSPAKPLSGLDATEQELALVKIAKVIRDTLQS